MLSHLLLSWLISAFSIWLAAQIVTGIRIDGFGTAMVAAVVIAVVNATIGFVLRIVAFPLTFITLGLFLFVINAFSAEAVVDAGARFPRARISGRAAGLGPDHGSERGPARGNPLKKKCACAACQRFHPILNRAPSTAAQFVNSSLLQ
jgi:putative membrane protein